MHNKNTNCLKGDFNLESSDIQAIVFPIQMMFLILSILFQVLSARSIFIYCEQDVS